MPNAFGDQIFQQHDEHEFCLGQLDSKPSSPKTVFKYESLHHANSIRLLELGPARDQAEALRGRLFEQTDFESAGYEALSYVWGIDGPKDRLELGESTMQISTALHLALQSLRQPSSPRILWVDAICINQEDDKEKMDQICRMGSIYKSAERVLIWLGEATPNTAQAFEFIDHFSRRYGHTDEQSPPLMSCFGSFGNRSIEHVLPSYVEKKGPMICKMAESSQLEDILGRPWFTRLWIIQELLLSKSAVLICGAHRLNWTQFSYMLIVLHVVMDRNVINNTLLECLGPAWNLIQIQEQHRFSRMMFSTTMMLRAPITFLAFMNKQKCQEEKDRVFGILGLDDLQFNAIGLDSSLLKMAMTTEEAYTLLSVLFLARGSNRVSSIINFSGFSRHNREGKTPDDEDSTSPDQKSTLPSWALDISSPKTFQRFPWTSGKFNAGGDWNVGYNLQSASSLALEMCQSTCVHLTNRPIGPSPGLDFFCGLWIWLQYQVGASLHIAKKLEGRSTEEATGSDIVTYDSIDAGTLRRFARTLLADGVALAPELDILEIADEPARMDSNQLQSLWGLFEIHFLAEGGELRSRYEKISELPFSELVQGKSILVGAAKPVTDAELVENLSDDAAQAWNVYVAIRSIFEDGVFAVLKDGKFAIVPSVVKGGSGGGEICCVPGLPMPQVFRATRKAKEVEGGQTNTCRLVGPAYVENLMDGEGIVYTDIGDGLVTFPAAIVV